MSKWEIPSESEPIEFLYDRELAFKDYKSLKPFQDWEGAKGNGAIIREYPEVRVATRRWCEQQDGHKILLTTPSVLVGFRVEVYRVEGTTQWYTAVIVGYNEATRVNVYFSRESITATIWKERITTIVCARPLYMQNGETKTNTAN